MQVDDDNAVWWILWGPPLAVLLVVGVVAWAFAVTHWPPDDPD